MREAIALIDLFVKDNAGDRLRQVESRRLTDLRALLTGHETLRSLAAQAKAENQRRKEMAERLLRVLPSGLRAGIVRCFA